MSRRTLYRILFAIFVVGAVLRVIAWKTEPPHHPDEYYQYIEPAWLRLTGVGVEPWEWRDGVRSWVLPAYNGAWMAFLRTLGLSGGNLTELIQLHWAFISLVLVWAGFRGGILLARQAATAGLHAATTPQPLFESAPIGWQGGLLGAGFCACFPILVLQSPHTLSETPSMLALVWSVVLAMEAVEPTEPHPERAACLAGAFASLAVCFRVANGPIALVPFAILVVARKWRLLVRFAAAGIVPVVFFGIVDSVTWGGFLSSYIRYIRFNFIDGKAAKFGVSPGQWYWQVFIERLPTFIALLFGLTYTWRKHVWPYLAASLGLLVYLTTQGHKEERFIVASWPFFLIAVAGVIGGWLARLQLLPSESHGNALRRWSHKIVRTNWAHLLASFIIVILVSSDGLLHSKRMAVESRKDYTRGLVQAQTWVGKRYDLVGVIVEQMGAGYAWLGSSALMITFQKATLVRNPVLNYAIVLQNSGTEQLVLEAGYEHIRSFGNYDVYRKLTRPNAR